MEDKMRVFESLVAGLENIGVTAAFGGAGETCTGMMLALKHSTQIRGIITRHEQAASFMACGYAMYTNHLRSEEHTSELQSRFDLVCRLLLEKKKPKETSCGWTRSA